MITDDLFTFPIVMVDGENEERKEKENDLLGSIPGAEKEVEYDIVYGEASYPYYDFKGFEDRWLPTQRSLQRALKQKFDACIVRFDGIGQFLVPMSKEKFKESYDLFVAEREKPLLEGDKKVTVIKLTSSDIVNLINKADEKEGE